jgi:hypothetical protein
MPIAVSGASMRRLLTILILLAVLALSAHADETFQFVYVEDEQYRVLSTVEQDVWVNNMFSHHATIYNRIAISITDVEDGRGFHEATFVTSEESMNGTQAFQWGQEYESRFWRDAQGYYDIEPEYYMPVVRDVPVFPDTSLSPGTTWTSGRSWGPSTPIAEPRCPVRVSTSSPGSGPGWNSRCS